MIEKIKATFVNDSLKELESIENTLISNEGVSTCLIEQVFTTAHNIKGTAPMLGILGVDTMVKPIEIVFKELREGNLRCSPEIVSNTQKLIPAIKSELMEEQAINIDSRDVDESLRFFDSLISKNA